MCQLVHVLLRVCEDNEFVDFMHSFFSQSILTRFDSFTLFFFFFFTNPKIHLRFPPGFSRMFRFQCCASISIYLLPSDFNNYLSSHYSLLVCYTVLHSLISLPLCIRSIVMLSGLHVFNFFFFFFSFYYRFDFGGHRRKAVKFR